MSQATLTVFGPIETREVALDPRGTTLGRGRRCHVQLESQDVSREHARISKDPFGRWIVEDLGSSNGTFINGRRVESSPVAAGEPIVMGPFSLILSEPTCDDEIDAEGEIRRANIVMEDFETEFLYSGHEIGGDIAQVWPDRLADVQRRLNAVTTRSALHHELCRSLACVPKSIAIVLRLPVHGEPIPKSPEVLSCDFGVATEGQDAGGAYPTPLAFRVSHRVLEHVRSSDEPVMAKSIYTSDVDVTYTAVDEHSPRAVICAPLGPGRDGVEVIYLDIPITATAGGIPEKTFAFVREVAACVRPRLKHLAGQEARSRRSNLDHELALARDIQRRFMPVIGDDISGVFVGLWHKPVPWVGGDYCDLWMLDGGRLAFVVLQMDARGVTAAMLMPELRALLRTALRFDPSGARALEQAHSYIARDESHEVCVGATVGVLDVATASLELANAGGPRTLLARGGAVTLLGRDTAPPLGGAALEVETVAESLADGARVVLCSDGVTNATSPENRAFGLEQVARLIKDYGSRATEKLPHAIAEAVDAHRGGTAQQEDMTILAISPA